MGYEDKMLEHITSFRAILLPGEEILFSFYGSYTSGSYNNMMGTWAATSNRLLFTGKAKYSAGGGLIGLAAAKSGRIITIPFSQILTFTIKKHQMKIIHTAEHEGKNPGAKRGVLMMPARLLKTGAGKKESNKELIARAGVIFNDIKQLMEGHPYSQSASHAADAYGNIVTAPSVPIPSISEVQNLPPQTTKPDKCAVCGSAMSGQRCSSCRSIWCMNCGAWNHPESERCYKCNILILFL